MYKHLRDKEKEKSLSKFEVYEILRTYCKENIDSSLSEMRSSENFSMAAWSEHQAYQLGVQKAFEKVLNFLPLTKESNV